MQSFHSNKVNTNLHTDGCVPLDESPFIAADPVVVHAVPSIQDGPVCGQLDHHILPSVAAWRLIHLCIIKQGNQTNAVDVYGTPCCLN